ncbi:Tn3 family transposase [Streptomyces sp. NPDC014724]|uniref:Tn3 family transposase n=1 Tax=Streptomyces sp. NPDC014724 TaxID=3364882 RepID=UPI0036F7CD4F
MRDRDLQREIQEGLNVVEGWNGANDIIFFGKSGELSSNRRDQQELSVLALHLLQTAVVFVNTLMIQEMLADPRRPRSPTPRNKQRTPATAGVLCCAVRLRSESYWRVTCHLVRHSLTAPRLRRCRRPCARHARERHSGRGKGRPAGLPEEVSR